MFRYFFVTIALLFLIVQVSLDEGRVSRSIAQHSTRPTLLVYIPQARGGYGDIASNLLMIEKLKKRGFEIKTVVSDKALRQVAHLKKSFWPDQVVSDVDGVKFYNQKLLNNWPKADVSITFSTMWGDLSTPKELENYSNFFLFLEYSDLVGGTEFLDSHSIGMNPHQNLIEATAGVGRLGAYIDEAKPDPSVDFKAFKKLVTEEFPVHSFNELTESSEIGFSYTNNERLTNRYVRGVADYIQKNGITRNFYLFVRKFSENDFSNLPKNVKVIDYSTITFDLSRILVSHANIPIAVTGDVSLSLALDYEKVFIYEMNNWKKIMVEDLIGEFEKHAKKRFPLLEESKEFSSLFDRMMHFSPHSDSFGIEEISKIMQNKPFQEQFSQTIASFRKKNSLPANVDSLISMAKTFMNKKKKINKRTFETMVELALSLPDKADGDLLEWAKKVMLSETVESDDKARIFSLIFFFTEESERKVHILLESLQGFSSKEIRELAWELRKSRSVEVSANTLKKLFIFAEKKYPETLAHVGSVIRSSSPGVVRALKEDFEIGNRITPFLELSKVESCSALIKTLISPDVAF